MSSAEWSSYLTWASHETESNSPCGLNPDRKNVRVDTHAFTVGGVALTAFGVRSSTIASPLVSILRAPRGEDWWRKRDEKASPEGGSAFPAATPANTQRTPTWPQTCKDQDDDYAVNRAQGTIQCESCMLVTSIRERRAYEIWSTCAPGVKLDPALCDDHTFTSKHGASFFYCSSIRCSNCCR